MSLMQTSALLRSVAFALSLLCSSESTWSQVPFVPVPTNNTDINDPDRKQAMQLFQDHKWGESAALFEKVVAKYPKDVVAYERLGAVLISRADTQNDPEKRKADRQEARAALLKAKELGDNSDLVSTLLAEIPESGESLGFSPNPEVNATMQRGEAAFANGRFDEAIREYSHALDLDPKLFVAALDTGDCYYRQKQWDKAGEWFARAIQIDPNQESAYRYWGDTLMGALDMGAARSKYIDGLLVWPYQPTGWNGLRSWALRNHVVLTGLAIHPPNQVTSQGTATVINIDPNTLGASDGREAWIVYPLQRRLWQQQEFGKQYPSEQQYRHSLKEEVSALSLVADRFDELRNQGKVKNPDSELVRLSELNQKKLLEPYVLLMTPDAGIARDYKSYCDAHRDKLVEFLDQYVVPAAPAASIKPTNIQ